jgi:hypothetical protein
MQNSLPYMQCNMFVLYRRPEFTWFIRAHTQTPYRTRVYSSVTRHPDACAPLQRQSPIDVLNKAFRGLGASGTLTDILTSRRIYSIQLLTSYDQAITRCRLLCHR